MTGPIKVPVKVHPRVFAALGADLVTNDIVAVIELVKNSYDAFAENVYVRFLTDPATGPYLEIEDDGHGMSRDVIEGVWCVVATPYKEQERLVRSGRRTRRVSGEKGLGRLSAARLGKRLSMVTKTIDGPCWSVDVDWSALAKIDDIAEAGVSLSEYDGDFRQSGTSLRIYLRTQWSEDRIAHLRENLSRLVSPFDRLADFHIFISVPTTPDAVPVRIEAETFLSKPKYHLDGRFDDDGNLHARYSFSSISEDKSRDTAVKPTWAHILNSPVGKKMHTATADTPCRCGGFDFEMRAWDIGPDDTGEIANRYGIGRRMVRSAIRAHKGISLYRDGILVLPKTDGAADWLGLDLRRISKMWTRLSTSQIVGYVSIGAESNPEIKDTSDRERLASNGAVSDFEMLLTAAVSVLEDERDKDRPGHGEEGQATNLFESLAPGGLIGKVREHAKRGADADSVVADLEEFVARVEATSRTLQRRFRFYSQLATVGTVAQMLVHEIRNCTTVVSRYLSSTEVGTEPVEEERLQKEWQRAKRAVQAMERLADRFLPLSSRTFRRGRRRASVEGCIRECLELTRGSIIHSGVRCQVPQTDTVVPVDPGELATIFLNLITNAIYWLRGVEREKRAISFSVEARETDGRIKVEVEDSGTGIEEGEGEQIFWPGFTKKPNGIGMGLTVASELVASYGGVMSTRASDSGAVFVFDLPTGE